jgi:DNA-binding NtrC family response regulator
LPSRILVVDDEKNIRRVLQALLEGDGHTVDDASDGDEARALLRRSAGDYDLVLTDLRMPNCDGLELLRWTRESHPDTPVVMLTAHGTVDIAVEAMRAGAFDFITKPFDDEDLSGIVGRALAQREANRQRAYPLGQASSDGASDSSEGGASSSSTEADEVLAEIIGTSRPMQDLFVMIKKVAPSPTTILVRGESGTGKELVGSAIHRLSERANGPFIAVNCTAIPEMLFESELFGHEKGAFTGAIASRPGRFELADGGTLLLDEIGELPGPMQVKLLRVLQERFVQRVGGLSPIPVDVRLIAATNANLEKMVADGSFREDLFYRLNVVPIVLPPLRERPTDIPFLIRHFAARFSERLGKPLRAVTPAVEAAMTEYGWPGNIRQLENVIERMVLLAEGDSLDLSDLPPEVLQGERDPEAGVDTARDEPLPSGKMKDIVKQSSQKLERDLIAAALDEEDRNVTRAAKRLGISRKGLQLKMKEYGLRETKESDL